MYIFHLLMCCFYYYYVSSIFTDGYTGCKLLSYCIICRYIAIYCSGKLYLLYWYTYIHTYVRILDIASAYDIRTYSKYINNIRI